MTKLLINVTMQFKVVRFEPVCQGSLIRREIRIHIIISRPLSFYQQSF